ncbi:MAG: DNA polymerase beta superfamily protein [Bacteroidaceae bacterium]
MTNFDLIRQEGRLLYEYVRGSHLYGLNTPQSDVDTSGVFICRPDDLLGLFGYKAQVSDERHDNTWFEIGELIRLVMKSNPTMLESIFVPEEMIIGEVSPVMRLVLKNREKFISKQCFNPFYGYAKSQIEKARGLNKKIVNPVTERLTPYDFIYTFRGQGSTRLCDWLRDRGLKDKFCGLVNIPNMHDMYGVYYDFGAHAAADKNWNEDKAFIQFARECFGDSSEQQVVGRISALLTAGYRGIIDSDGASNDLRLSSIDDKDVRPICFASYNQTGYTSHCRQYHDYQEWVRMRNPVRFESNLDKNYDSKNMMHCFRLMHMAQEIARGEGIILKRTWDHDFLMDVRNHKFEYEQIIEMLDAEKEKMNNLMEASTIREKVDAEFANDLLLEIRHLQFSKI